MKVRMRVQITGLRNNVRWPGPGEVVDLPDAEAAKLCKNGFADPVVEERVEKRPAAAKRTEKRKA